MRRGEQDEEILSKKYIDQRGQKLAQKKYRNQTNTYIIDGWHLVQEAIAASAPINYLFVTDKGIQETGNQLKRLSRQSISYLR